MRGESQPTKKMHSLQKQDSSKYLTGVDVTQVASHENIDKRIANRTNREKSGISSQSKSQANNVIYKVSSPASMQISEPFFSIRPNFCREMAPSERMNVASVSLQSFWSSSQEAQQAPSPNNLGVTRIIDSNPDF